MAILPKWSILALPTRPGLSSPLSFSPTHPLPPQGWTKPTLHTSAADFNPAELYIEQELSESLSISPVLRHARGGKKITVFTWRASTFSLHLPQYHLGLRQITCMIPEDNSEDTRSSDSSSGNFPLGTQLLCFLQDIQNLKTRNPSAGASGTFGLQWDNNRHQKGFGELPRSSRNSEPSSPGYRFINCPLPSNSLLPYNFPSMLSSFCVKLSPYLSSNQTSFAVWEILFTILISFQLRVFDKNECFLRLCVFPLFPIFMFQAVCLWLVFTSLTEQQNYHQYMQHHLLILILDRSI